MTKTVFTTSRAPVYAHRLWAYRQPNSVRTRSCQRAQRHSRQAATQPFAKLALDIDSADQMRRIGEDVQEAFASGKPDTLTQKGEDMMQDYLKQMEVVRKKVLQQPGILPELVRQLHSGDSEMKIKAAEMLFCVVGQGPGRDVDATREALDNRLLEAVLSVMQATADTPATQVRQNQDVQQLMALLVAMLTQISVEEGDEAVIQAAAALGGVKTLRSAFDVVSGDGTQQNLVSMLWHWTVRGGSDVRQQIMDCGIAELQVSLLGLQHSPVQRQMAADQLAAYVAYPNQQQEDQPPDTRLAEDLIHAGAAMALIEMLSSEYHEQVRCSAGQAIATLATVCPSSKAKIIAMGAYHAVVSTMQPSEPESVRQCGAMLLITLAAGDPGEGAVFTQTEAAVRFTAMGVIPALAEMLSPINEASTRVMALQAVAVLASSFEERVQKALVSTGILSATLDLLRVLAGRMEWDSSLDGLKQPTLIGMRLKCAEILGSLGVENPANIKLLVDSGAIPELTVVASDTDIPESERDPVMRMLHYMCKIDQDVLAILGAMMSD